MSMPMQATRAAMFLMFATAAALARAQTGLEADTPAQQSRRLDDTPEYGGVVTSQALTGLGHFFHAKFTEGWNTQSDVDSYVLLVKERPSPRGGSEIQVLSGDQVVFRSYLPRSYAAVAALSESAVDISYRNVVQQNLQNLLFDDPDLARSAY